jgi:hypothetical protein
MMIPLLLTLIAHVLADFILQTNAIVARKSQLKIAGFATHGLTVLATLLLLLHHYQLGQILIYSLLVTGVHLLLDWVKELIVARSKSRRTELVAFYVDQFLHCLVLLLIWQHFSWQPAPWVNGFYNWLVSPRLQAVFGANASLMTVSHEKVLLILLTYLSVCWGGVVFVDKFLDFLSVSGASRTQCNAPEIGRLIGIIERALILTFAINNSLTAVVFVFTAKSIARFNELNDRSFAEYYLVGTLLSTALAVGGGLAARFLLWG